MGHAGLAVVTGAFGYTGGYVARRLINQGIRVRTLSRRLPGRNPLGGLVEAHPLEFSDPDGLRRSMDGAGILYNTYWIRYARGGMTFDRAVENTGTLFEAAVGAGVGKIVHFSVTNASHCSELPYFRGKAQVEDMLKGLGVPYAVIRPTLVYGDGDVLLNNMAWALRRFPVFPVCGRGYYPVQPIYAEDVAALAVQAGSQIDNSIADAAGPETFTFEELLRLLASAMGVCSRLVRMPPRVGYSLTRLVGLVVRDVALTRHEVDGPHGWPAYVKGGADQRDQPEQLARGERGWPWEALCIRDAAKLESKVKNRFSARLVFESARGRLN